MTDKNNWKPQGAWAWLLTVVACLLAALMAGLAYFMIYPVRWDGPGKFGAVALFFPLHLLAFTFTGKIEKSRLTWSHKRQ